MFTGIVEETGTVRAVEPRGDVVAVTIEAGVVREGLAAGDSVAVNGCCLTAVTLAPGRFECELTPETLARTSFGVTLAVGGSTWSARWPPPVGSTATSSRATSTASAASSSCDASTARRSWSWPRRRRWSATWWRRARSPSTASR
jgi:hypothetical protein